MLVKVRDSKKGELPVTRNTVYKWHCEKKYPRLIFKVSGILYFDMEEWLSMAIRAKEGRC